mgnify:CR=1 FL=1
MSKKLALQNISAVEIGGKQPQEVFFVKAEGKVPVDLYWRKRLNEGAVKPYVEKSEAPASKSKKGKS